MGLGRLTDGLAPTPPLGWTSWNRFGAKIDERLVLETAEAMVATGMRDAGYRYVVIDDGWMAPERDRNGDLVADPQKFPHGIAALAERVHRLGLRFGIYTDAGTNTCQGLPASLGYEFRDARRFAEWGVDYLKVDWCHAEGMGPRALYTKWAMALRAAKRPIVLSICEWGRSRPWEWAGTVGHLWRTSWDIQPEWSSITTILDLQSELHPFSGADHWNDPDMLEVGNGDLTLSESRAHFALWCMLAAPLMAGNDLRTMTDDVRAIITAPELVAIDQDPLAKQARRIRADGAIDVWTRDLSRNRSAVAILNRGAKAREVRLNLEEMGVGKVASLRNVWERADIPAKHDEAMLTISAHDAVVLLVEGY
ncbi:MAG TPA: glycoside hydrolase family 27 protein [Candidatus Limnocylindria bacterium]|nr:glycoside hydrolase family 27 protein [Candidatus Limnocylindria bacterium]